MALSGPSSGLIVVAAAGFVAGYYMGAWAFNNRPQLRHQGHVRRTTTGHQDHPADAVADPDAPALLLSEVKAENAALKIQNTALRKENDDLSRRIISTAFIDDGDDEDDDDDASGVLSPIGSRKLGRFVSSGPPATPPLPTY